MRCSWACFRSVFKDVGAINKINWHQSQKKKQLLLKNRVLYRQTLVCPKINDLNQDLKNTRPNPNLPQTNFYFAKKTVSEIVTQTVL